MHRPLEVGPSWPVRRTVREAEWRREMELGEIDGASGVWGDRVGCCFWGGIQELSR